MRRRTEDRARDNTDAYDNLNVDVQNTLIQERASQACSEDSQVAILWNVFRSLQKLEPTLWLPRVLTHGLGLKKGSPRARALVAAIPHGVEFHWWKRYDVPPSRQEWLHTQALNADLDLTHYPARYVPEKKKEIARNLETSVPLEERVEVPLCIETCDWMLGVLAVYKGNLRQNTRYDARRDELIRLFDAGTWHAQLAGKRFLSLVVYADARTYNTETKRLIDLYRDNGGLLVARLPHRKSVDVLQECAKHVGELRWRTLGTLLLDAKDEERIGSFDLAVVDELVKYLARKDVGFNFFRRVK
jgi:hypothetical protein